MARTRATPLLIAALTALALLPAVAGGAPATGSGDPAIGQRWTPWQPHISEAAAWASGRQGHIAFAVATRGRLWGWHATRTYPSASLLKPILLVTYLNRSDVRDRNLRHDEKAMLSPMIERSDNNAAGRCLNIVGLSALRETGRRAHMRRFSPRTGVWGLSRIDALDQARFFLHIRGLIPSRHRSYAMHLLASITPSQRWGVGQVGPAGWQMYFKGGWGSGTGWVDHQTVLLVKGGLSVAVSILTHLDGSHAYGKATLRGLAERLFRGLPGAR
jgi:hypothetical protein